MQEKKPAIGCIVMAAGNARRFGENKLAAKVDGKPLILCALEAVPTEEFSNVAVVTQYVEVEALARRFGFTPIQNQHPDWGISHTISLGVHALAHCDALLFQVSDQPLLKRQSVKALIQLWRTQPDKLAALSHNGVRGNPCIFPARFYPELLALQEDHGGNTVIRSHEQDLILQEVARQELTDVDTVQALNDLK